MRTVPALAFAIIVVGLMDMTANAMKPLPTVPKVELSRYSGTWNEVARLPFFFQHSCTDFPAEYRLDTDGTILVINCCLKNGKTKQVRGIATLVDMKTNDSSRSSKIVVYLTRAGTA